MSRLLTVYLSENDDNTQRNLAKRVLEASRQIQLVRILRAALVHPRQ